MATWRDFYKMWDSDEARSLLATPLPVERPEKTSSLYQLLAKTKDFVWSCHKRPAEEAIKSRGIKVLATLVQRFQEAPSGAWGSLFFKDGSGPQGSVLKSLSQTVVSNFKKKGGQGV